MRDPTPEITAEPGRVLLSDRLSTFRRIYRWFNLTLVQQGIWPLLLLLVASAPAVTVSQTPWPWFLARIAAPLTAAGVSLIYLRQTLPTYALYGERPIATIPDTAALPVSDLARQARYVLLGVPVIVAALRLLAGPFDEASRLILFGLADVAAYHLINFGVVPRSYADRTRGLAVGTLLFGVSWALRDALLVGVGTEDGSVALAAFTGLFVGWVVAIMSRFIQRWPGGYVTAAAVHWLVIYLIIGFV